MKYYLLFFFWSLMGLSYIQAQNQAELDLNFTGLVDNSQVKTAVLQPDGKILIGGGFTSVNGTPINRIARLNSDGSLDTSFFPGTESNIIVEVIALQPDGKILVGGNFFSLDGNYSENIVRLNSDGSLDASFAPIVGANSVVYSIGLQSDGKILIGGDFTEYDDQEINGIARLNPDGSLDTSFNPGSGVNNTVWNITVLPDSKILIGGAFTTYSGSARNRIARLNTNGSLDPTFNLGTGANSTIWDISLQTDGKILIVGNFTSYNGTISNRIARLNGEGSLDPSFNAGLGPNTTVYRTKVQSDGKVIIGGIFTSFNGSARNYIAGLNSDGSLDTSFNPGTGFNGTVWSIFFQPDGKIVIGGSFTIYNDILKLRIVRLLGGSGSSEMVFPKPDVETLPDLTAECVFNFRSLTAPTATAEDGGTVIGTTDESIFPINQQGTTTIIWTYTDANGLESTQEQNIVIADITPPTITLPAEIIVEANADQCFATGVNLGSPVTTDNCGIGSVVNNALSSFPVGVTEVLWTVTDVGGNTAQFLQIVTVQDIQLPVIAEISDITVSADPGVCMATNVSLLTPPASDNCGIASTENDAPEEFPVGTTTVTWTVADPSGNTATRSFNVIVNDNEVPTIIAPANINVQIGEEEEFTTDVEHGTPDTDDNCGVAEVSNDAPTSFGLGTTTVTWTVTDVNGNTGKSEQLVIVSRNIGDCSEIEKSWIDANQFFYLEWYLLPGFAGIYPNIFDGFIDKETFLEDGLITGDVPLQRECHNCADIYSECVANSCASICLSELNVDGSFGEGCEECIRNTPCRQDFVSCVGLVDQDGDGWASGSECDDSDSEIFPRIWYRDMDGDGYGIRSESILSCEIPEGYAVQFGDCDDTDPEINPGAMEICGDGLDNNCDGLIDPDLEWYRDQDGDGYGSAEDVVYSCEQPEGYVGIAGDCDDTDPLINPGAEEVCDGLDNNCSGIIDDGFETKWYEDSDGDGFGNPEVEFIGCNPPIGYVDNALDCNDGDPEIYPGQGCSLECSPLEVRWIDQNQYFYLEWYLPLGFAGIIPDFFEGFIDKEASLEDGLITGYVPLQRECHTCADFYSECVYNSCFSTCFQEFATTGNFGAGCEECIRNTPCRQEFVSCVGLVDEDGDGWASGSDCDDNDPEIFPGSTIACPDTGNCQLVSAVDASASSTPVPLGGTASLIASVTPNIEGVSVTFTVENEANETIYTNTVLTNDIGQATATTSILETVGVLKVTATVGVGCSPSVAYIPVYDASGSFVTGGGWINSPEGAYAEDPLLVGKANFGFVSRYKKGSNQVNGNTEFQFQAGSLNFKSTMHEAGSLVISGKRATYRGTGSINGQSGFKFVVVAIDGNWNGQSNPDEFRIKISTDSGLVIYDNQMGKDEITEDATILGNNGQGGGSIVIHEVKPKGKKRIAVDIQEVAWNTPFETIEKDLIKMSKDWFEGYGVTIKWDYRSYDQLASGFHQVDGFVHYNPWFDVDEAISVPVLVLNKPLATDIQISNAIIAKNAGVGFEIGTLSTVDPVDNIHVYHLDDQSSLQLIDNRLIWTGSGEIPVSFNVTVHSTDRAGQTISRKITLHRELARGEILIYPNPAKQETNILVQLSGPGTVDIRIFDAAGRLAYEEKEHQEASFVRNIDLKGLSSGMYQVIVQSGNEVMTGRLVKEE